MTVNLVCGNGFSVLEIVAAVERVTGFGCRLIEQPRRPGDPPALVASNDLARELLGFVPRYSSLDGTIETAWNWTRARAAACGPAMGKVS